MDRPVIETWKPLRGGEKPTSIMYLCDIADRTFSGVPGIYKTRSNPSGTFKPPSA